MSVIECEEPDVKTHEGRDYAANALRRSGSLPEQPKRQARPGRSDYDEQADYHGAAEGHHPARNAEDSQVQSRGVALGETRSCGSSRAGTKMVQSTQLRTGPQLTSRKVSLHNARAQMQEVCAPEQSMTTTPVMPAQSPGSERVQPRPPPERRI
jgi:hypothetical protein